MNKCPERLFMMAEKAVTIDLEKTARATLSDVTNQRARALAADLRSLAKGEQMSSLLQNILALRLPAIPDIEE